MMVTIKCNELKNVLIVKKTIMPATSPKKCQITYSPSLQECRYKNRLYFLSIGVYSFYPFKLARHTYTIGPGICKRKITTTKEFIVGRDTPQGSSELPCLILDSLELSTILWLGSSLLSCLFCSVSGLNILQEIPHRVYSRALPCLSHPNI